jgi:hypothetical protein
MLSRYRINDSNRIYTMSRYRINDSNQDKRRYTCSLIENNIKK